MPETTTHDAISVTDPIGNLPLRLLRSEIVPPAPTRSQSSIDWLPDFAGYSWLAYGASTLLVISHLPSPLRGEDSTNGTIFRQILEVSSSPVTSVSWSPVTPPVGELAVGSGNCIYLFARDPNDLNGSFCWSQNAILVQETNVEAIEWTGSGDGIIVGGSEIVLWKRKNQSWEIAWKFSGDNGHLQVHDLVSSTWSFEGPFASATSWSKFPAECDDQAGKRVLAYYSDGETYRKVELPHPQRISMIQWRPVVTEQSARCIGKSMRNVLMTCCLDGAVRLWCEVDSGKTKKGMKDVNDHKKMFCVVAVIEINQVLDGYLGRDLFLFWGTRTGGILKTIEGTNQLFSTEKYDHENVGNCEWLVGYGPGKSTSLWAVHCLDDISPMRFPRVTLWARQESNEIDAGSSDQLPLKKVSVLRNNLYGTPLICSSIYLSPQNTVYWSSLHTIKSHDSEDSSPNKSSVLKCITGKILDLDGHGGKILQVAFDPIICETGYTASLDSNGLIIFWSSCAYLNRAIDHPISVPSWKPCGRLQNQELRLKYTSICWAPSSLNDERFLLVGHVEGVGCFSVRNGGRGDDGFLTRYICTIPFAVNSRFQNGPTSIFAIPLSNSCGKTFKNNSFLLLSVWMKENQFDALSWRVTLHHSDTAGSTCDFHDSDSIGSGKWLFEDTFAGKTNCIAVRSCSSEIPESHRDDEVTSFAVVNPSGRAVEDDENSESQAYTMATGQADGSLKLWRSNSQESSTPSVLWELVGMVTIGQNPVSAISLTDSGHKIAALCTENHSKAVHTVSIWEIVHLVDSGVFILEDKLHIDAEVVSVRWSTLGNDQLLLGVCTQKEMRVYGIARQPCRNTSFAVSDYSSEAQIWQCFAVTSTFSAIHDVWWRSKAMTALVHNDYVSLHGQWLAVIDKKQKIDNNPEIFVANLPNLVNATEEGRDSELLSDSGCIPLPPTSNAIDDWQSNTINDITNVLDMVEKLGGALPLHHPQALLVAIRSGNWKRASAALRHFAEYITSSDSSEKKSDLCSDILLSKYYEGSLSNGPNHKDFQWGGNSQFQSSFSMDSYSSNSSHSSPATDLEFSGFCEQLEKLPEGGNISTMEKMQYFAIVDLLCEISNPQSTSVYASLDEAGRRFWVTLRFKQLYLARSSGKTASMEELDIDSSMIGWAYHSESQENLSGSLLPNESTWQQMRSLGFGFWYSNVAQLRSRMEKLARQQYLKKKNPKDCALLYIALNRVQVLAGLFKISKDERDKPLVAFLSRNFQEEKNKAAALKNAYVLMGKHQLEMAIGFFLLGGEASSAINVCVKNLHDEQLALVICRLVDGQSGSLESNLINKHILPSALQRGDFWLASLLKWELGEYHESFLAMASCLKETSTVSSNHIAFVDPSIGLYCLMLANKNNVKNALGERNASNLSRWATLMASTAFSRCGLPLEALECLGGTHQASVPSSNGVVLEHSVTDSSNWVSNGVSSTVDTHFRFGLAIQFLSKLLKETTNSEIVSRGFQRKVDTDLEFFHQRFSLSSSSLRNTMIFSAYNRGLHNIISHTDDDLLVILKATEEKSFVLQRIIAACSIITCLHSEEPKWSNALRFYFEGILKSFSSLRTSINLCVSSSSAEEEEDLKARLTVVFELLEYCSRLAMAWVLGDVNRLFRMIQPLTLAYFHQHEVDLESLKSVYHEVSVPDVENNLNSIPEDERRLITQACLWKYVFDFVRHKLVTTVSINLDTDGISNSDSNGGIVWVTEKIISVFGKTLISNLAQLSSYHVKQLVSVLKRKVEKRIQVPTLLWLHESDRATEKWNLCVDPGLVNEAFSLENFDISEWFKFKRLEDWSDMYREVTEKKNELVSTFQNPKEIHKRNGELIEALCINAINHRQAALASNRKGIIFFNPEDDRSHDEDEANYIWSEADWPHNGWANSESTPIPTYVSLGIGLGDKKGAHLGLGGATVGNYHTGLGEGEVSGLGWETQEDFETFIDPPPTIESVVTRAFSSHPKMPLFLVGSSNTHIYLWEFGKERASATYGVLPAANVPPPYALASISAVKFGPCGHRFASAALDGTVCTWQAEVGGRSNIHPVESSLCFNGHASDVEYISWSGSIVTASGYSSSGANVVVWDTLAPPSTSQASINCHEGGARSISVFDNDIGSGSISPMIVTGGKNGDVGLHDFRFIATGKMKKQRNVVDGGDQNKNGMLWYIPKAHLGSVTKITTIPRTSLFLTGSKDGDVKLWDAKAAKLIHQWPKLHERHTFLQPNSRGYGGIIRAGVTDIQVCPNGFITCGGDGTVKFISLKDSYNDGR